jgi:cobalt-zinc-cadmium efflux system membrane fusion protein
VHWNSDRLVHVSPRVGGVVLRVEKTLGDAVEPQELLCVLDSREMGNAKMEYLADLGRHAVAQADFERATLVYENTAKLLEILGDAPPPGEALARAHDLPVGDNKNRLLTAYTRLRVNQRNFERTEGLLEKKIASEVEHLEAKGAFEISHADYLSTYEEIRFDLELAFLRAKRDFQLAETEMRNSERALHILGVTDEELASLRQRPEGPPEEISRSSLYSPMRGMVVDRHITRGELVGTDSRLYTIADLSEVWVLGRVYERDLRFLRPGQKATVSLDAFPGELFDGTVEYLGSELDPRTRTIEARVALANPQRRFRPGMFGRVMVFTEHEHTGEAHEDAFLVPLAALQRTEAGYVVYVMLAPGEFRETPVQVIAQSKEFAEITGEIQPGARLATGDTFILKSEVSKEKMGGGHSH